MTNLVQWVLKRLARSDIAWFFLKPVVLFGGALSYARRVEKSKPKSYSHLFKEKTVLNGPFKGTRYPAIESVYSQIYPKLIGSYEHELHLVIEQFCSRRYSEILDVGCAEGYYAIGLARRIEGATVYAYDIEPTARALCRRMAKLNHVDGRVHVGEHFGTEELKRFKVTEKGLIICDCEGFEKELFTADTLESLKRFDVLIEVHDFIDVTISDYLHKLFSETHDIEVIRSVDDIDKARTYAFLPTDLSLRDKMKLYEEKRGGMMEWMICSSRA